MFEQLDDCRAKHIVEWKFQLAAKNIIFWKIHLINTDIFGVYSIQMWL